MVDEKQYTFRDVDELSNRVGNYFYELGYRYGMNCLFAKYNGLYFVYYRFGKREFKCILTFKISDFNILVFR